MQSKQNKLSIEFKKTVSNVIKYFLRYNEIIL